MSDPVGVRKEVIVAAPREHVFDVFTRRFDAWWPRSHHIGTCPTFTAILEPRAGGRWYERGTDGSECEWGHVLEWSPPRRVLLAWNLDPDWQILLMSALRDAVQLRDEVRLVGFARLGVEPLVLRG